MLLYLRSILLHSESEVGWTETYHIWTTRASFCRSQYCHPHPPNCDGFAGELKVSLLTGNLWNPWPHSPISLLSEEGKRMFARWWNSLPGLLLTTIQRPWRRTQFWNYNQSTGLDDSILEDKNATTNRTMSRRTNQLPLPLGWTETNSQQMGVLLNITLSPLSTFLCISECGRARHSLAQRQQKHLEFHLIVFLYWEAKEWFRMSWQSNSDWVESNFELFCLLLPEMHLPAVREHLVICCFFNTFIKFCLMNYWGQPQSHDSVKLFLRSSILVVRSFHRGCHWDRLHP